MATATKLGPIGINQVNDVFYVGLNGGFSTIQAAVDYVKKYNGGAGEIVIVHGFPDDEPISSVTNGSFAMYLSDQRDTLIQNYDWNGTGFSPADFEQLADAVIGGLVKAFGFTPPDMSASHTAIGTGGGPSGSTVPALTHINVTAPVDQRMWVNAAYPDKLIFASEKDDGTDYYWMQAQRTGHQVNRVVITPPTDVQGVLTAQGSPVRTFANSPGPDGGGGVNPAPAQRMTFYQVDGALVSGTQITTDVDGTQLDVPGVVTSEGSPVRTFDNTPNIPAPTFLPINIFDYTGLVAGTIFSDTGALDPTSTWGWACPFMDLRGAPTWCANIPIHAYSPAPFGIAYYDASHTYISGITIPGDNWPVGTVFTVPVGATYMRCFFTDADCYSVGVFGHQNIMILAGPVVPEVFQPFDPTTRYGETGIKPGQNLTVAIYPSTGQIVTGSQVSTDPTGKDLTVPGVHTAFQVVQNGGAIFPSGLPDTPGWVQENKTTKLAGAGWSLGGAGGWSGGFGDLENMYVGTRGIHQTRGAQMNKHAVGDTAGLYMYVHSDGGISAHSDEGVSGLTSQALEYVGWFHGHVVSTSGTGDRAPVLAFDSGNPWTTDGAFLLNITKATITGRVSGPSAATTYTVFTGDTTQVPFHLPVTGVTLPISDAAGIAITAIPYISTTADRPLPMTITVQLVQIGGIYKPFTVGGHVAVGGFWYPEQSFITAASAVTSDKKQDITLSLRNPNGSGAIIFQGGIAGTYISFQANLPFGSRSSYYAFGSLTGTDLIYGFTPFGQIVNGVIPKVNSEAGQHDGGPNSVFLLCPGAEVVCNNTPDGFDCTLEPNNVAWTAGDLVENPHYPAYSGGPGFFVQEQTTPSFEGANTCALAILMQGNGIGGTGTAAVQIRNNRDPTHYLAQGGFCAPPDLFGIVGHYGTGFDFLTAPEFAVLHIENPANPSNPNAIISVLEIMEGRINFNPGTNTWGMLGNFSAVGDVAGITLSIRGGINNAGTHTISNITFITNNGENDIIFNGNPASGAGGIIQSIRAAAIGGGEVSTYHETDHTGVFRFRVKDDWGGTMRQAATIDVNGLVLYAAPGNPQTELDFNVAGGAVVHKIVGYSGFGVNTLTCQTVHTGRFDWYCNDAGGTPQLVARIDEVGIHTAAVVEAASFKSAGATGVSGTATSANTLTIVNGIVTAIV